MNLLSRKQFLRDVATWGLGLFVGAANATQTEVELDPALAGLASDFPDSLLREEASRLGLDTSKASREEMLAAVAAAMRPPTPPLEDGAGPDQSEDQLLKEDRTIGINA
jgi:hypothetical protein